MDFKFCPHCGASLSGAPGAGFCPACGGALGGGDKKRGHPFLLAGLALLFGGALLAGLLWFFKALPTPLFAGDLPWLCFTAESADATVGLEAVGNAPAVTLEISPDGRVWNDWVEPRVAYLHQPGDKLYVRAKNANSSFAKMNDNAENAEIDGWATYHHFTISGKVAASGNIMSLVDKEGKRLSLEGMDFAFALLFKDCAGLTAAPRLPATKLAEGCYAKMFMNCAGLTQAPELPAAELSQACYAGMFEGCIKLATAPKILPATKLAEGCYAAMFLNCAGLTHAPELPATGLSQACYAIMFEGCTALTTAPKRLPAPEAARFCYGNMFKDCVALTAAPELPATKLAERCYAGMFEGCIKLATAPKILPATKLAEGCYAAMFLNCAGLTRAPGLPATTLAKNCYGEMFKGCANLTTAPQLPAAATGRETSGIGTMLEGCDGIKDKPKK